jgi:DNA-binding NarL/FixJ family response regulator
VGDSIWIVDAQMVATAVAGLLSEWLGRPVCPVSFVDMPSGSGYNLALIEIFLPGGCGIATAAHLRRMGGGRVVVWSSRPAPLYGWVSWRIGLSGCLDKDDSLAAISDAVQRLLDGAAFWSPCAWQQVETFEAELGSRLSSLTRVEWQRWLDLVRGLSLKETATSWGITLRGASKARERLCEKLQLPDSKALVELAWSADLVKIKSRPVWSEAILTFQAECCPK